MDLAVVADHPFGAHQHGRVEDPIGGQFQHAKDRIDAQLATESADCFGGRSGNGFGMRTGFFEAVKAIAGQGAFGEHREHGTFGGRAPQVGFDAGQVGRVVGKVDVHLDAGDLHEFWHDVGIFQRTGMTAQAVSLEPPKRRDNYPPRSASTSA